MDEASQAPLPPTGTPGVIDAPLAPPVDAAPPRRHHPGLPARSHVARVIASTPHVGTVVALVLLGFLAMFGLESAPIDGGGGTTALRLDSLLPLFMTPLTWMAVLATAAMLVFIAGGMDLSIGFTFTAASVASAAAVNALPHPSPAWLVLAVGCVVPVALGLLAGACNGALTGGLRIPSAPATLAVGVLLLSVVTALHGTESIVLDEQGTVLHRGSLGMELGNASPALAALQPVVVALMALILVVVALHLTRTAAGRSLHITGLSREAALHAGLRPRRAIFRAHLLAGALSGIAGLLATGATGASTSPPAWETGFAAIAAALVGGAAIAGGRGTAFGAFLGAMLITLIDYASRVAPVLNLGITRLTLTHEGALAAMAAAMAVAIAWQSRGRSHRREGW